MCVMYWCVSMFVCVSLSVCVCVCVCGYVATDQRGIQHTSYLKQLCSITPTYCTCNFLLHLSVVSVRDVLQCHVCKLKLLQSVVMHLTCTCVMALTDSQTDRQTHGRTDGRTDRRTDRRTDGRTDGPTVLGRVCDVDRITDLCTVFLQ